MAASVVAVEVYGYSAACDGGGARYARLSAAPAPVLAGHVQTADGAWWALESRNVIQVEQLGIFRGSSDNTAAVNNAVAWLAAGNGGTLRFGAGTYKILGTIVISAGAIVFEGAGQAATFLSFGSGVADCIVVASSVQLYGNRFRQLCINASSRTGGRAIYGDWVSQLQIEDVNFNSPYNGLELYYTNSVTLSTVQMQAVRGQWGIYWHAAADGSNRCDQLSLYEVYIDGGYDADGMWWDGYANTLNAFLFSCVNCRIGLWIKNSAESANYCPNFGVFDNFVTDGQTLRALEIDGGREFHFVNSFIENTSTPGATGPGTQGFNDDNAVLINGDTSVSYTSQIFFSACEIGNSKQGAVLVNGAQNIIFDGCIFRQGGKGGANQYDAVTLAGPAHHVQIVNCQGSAFGDPINWRFGVNVGPNCSNILVEDCDFSLALARPVMWQTTDSQSYCGKVIPNWQIGNEVAGKMTPTYLAPTSFQALTAAQMMGGVLQIGGATGGVVLMTPTAAQLVAQLDTPQYNKAMDLRFINSDSSAIQLVATAGVTASGNLATSTSYSIPAGTARLFTLVFTNTTPGSEAVHIWG
jgi:hypothetical protein